MVKQASLQWNRLRRARHSADTKRTDNLATVRDQDGLLILLTQVRSRGPDQGKSQGDPRGRPAARMSDGEWTRPGDADRGRRP